MNAGPFARSLALSLLDLLAPARCLACEALEPEASGYCTECGEPAAQGSRCLKHLITARERQREKRGLKRRYYGTLSYQLQGEPLHRSLGRPGVTAGGRAS